MRTSIFFFLLHIVVVLYLGRNIGGNMVGRTYSRRLTFQDLSIFCIRLMTIALNIHRHNKYKRGAKYNENVKLSF